MIKQAVLFLCTLACLCSHDVAQKTARTTGQSGSSETLSRVWVADNGDGTYKNPILHADYSDPDVIRVGDDYYLIASSFNAAPGSFGNQAMLTSIGSEFNEREAFASLCLVLFLAVDYLKSCENLLDKDDEPGIQ